MYDVGRNNLDYFAKRMQVILYPHLSVASLNQSISIPTLHINHSTQKCVEFLKQNNYVFHIDFLGFCFMFWSWFYILDKFVQID